MTGISKAVRFMSTLHGGMAINTRKVDRAIHSTIFSPNRFPFVLTTSMIISAMGGYFYQDSQRKSSQRQRHSSLHKTVIATAMLLALLLSTQPIVAFQPLSSSSSRLSLQSSSSRRRTRQSSCLFLEPRFCSRHEEREDTHHPLATKWNDFMKHSKLPSTAAAMTIFLTATFWNPSQVFANVDETTTASTTTPTTVLHKQESSLLLSETTTASPRTSSDTATTSQTLPEEQDNVVEEVWNLINKYYIDSTFNNQDWEKVKQQTLEEGRKYGFASDEKNMKIVTSMVQTLNDKYTRMLTGEQYASIQKFDLIGVGVTLMPNAQKDIIVGAPPIEGSSSATAGLKVGDFVTAVNGKPTRGRNAFDIIDQISEAADAKTVTFTILRKEPSSLETIGRDDNGETFDVTMDRQTMKVKDPVQYKLSEQRKDGTRVGYIRISEFNSLVNAKLHQALQELKKQGANAYVLDLRANTGGAFQSAVEISGMFLRDRVATYVVDRNQVELPFRTPKMQDLAIDPDVPMVIWLDGMSASASEVLAGSLHDNCRAVTMGDNSFGKGLIQAVYGLKNGAGLVVTVARYVTPGGYEIQGKGIVPDITGSMPAPVFIPGFSSDTSKVDFKDIAKRLDSNMCLIPGDRAPAPTASPNSLIESG